MLTEARVDTKSTGGSAPTLSVVVPTRNESGNIASLLARVRTATSGIPTEIVFVDDSTDNTPEVISERASTLYSSDSSDGAFTVSLVHRPPEARTGGLGGAVVEGFRRARGKWVCVMDADLQHPPERIPELLDKAAECSSDLVVASRYASAAQADGLGAARLAVSKSLTYLARAFFPVRLGRTTDPLTGFFLLRRDSIEVDELKPKGFKILLEILVRFPELKVSEIPFQFETRHSGESKASPREVTRFIALLLALRVGPTVARFSRFGFVGLTGILVNNGLLAAFAEIFGLNYILAAALATQGSTSWNFVLTERWVFNDRNDRQGWPGRLLQYALTNNVLLLLRGPFLILLTSGLGMHYLLSNFLTLAVLTLARYQLADGWIWRTKPRRAAYSYDIHGIVKVASDVKLPELTYFLTSSPVESPDITVRIGLRRRPVDTSDGQSETRRLRYGEIFGRAGFWVDITQGCQTSIVASPILRYSPHVLYTNVVEPILRWLFVQKGYALTHAACLAVGGKGILVTAKTDTGKTSTLLRVLAREPLDFLSDDMVILGRNGRALSYPKPLTISSHTLSAVNGAAELNPWERATLPLQSRVHSKNGRLLAKLLATIPVPTMATVNTIVQLIVPPPKYAVTRLVPGTSITTEAQIAHRVEIERGPDHEVELMPQVAEEMLLRNCEDAYGFPPYEALEPFLARVGGVNLHEQEQAIMHEALIGCGTTLVSSESRTWWPRVIDIAHKFGGATARRSVEPQPAQVQLDNVAA